MTAKKINPKPEPGKSVTIQDVVSSEEFMYNYGNSCGLPDPALFFLCHNDQVPSHRVIRNIEPTGSLIDEFILDFDIEETNVILDFEFSHKGGKFRKRRGIIMVQQTLIIYFDVQGPDPAIRIFYSHSSDLNLVDEVSEFFTTRIDYRSINNLGLLVLDPHMGMYVKNFTLNHPGVDLSLCYNDDFGPVHESIMNRLGNENGKGIVLLHGLPGTGKTTYIRYLSSMISKRMIFIPPDLAPQIASPEFLSLMVDNPNSILVIEDAENVIRDRMSDENLSVANLLNISDGLLSDCLHVQIICTFNTDISRIDKALLRKGRIIAKYEFGPLSAGKARMVSEKLGKNLSVTREMTLAEIYHSGDTDYTLSQKKIGFKAA